MHDGVRSFFDGLTYICRRHRNARRWPLLTLLIAATMLAALAGVIALGAPAGGRVAAAPASGPAVAQSSAPDSAPSTPAPSTPSTTRPSVTPAPKWSFRHSRQMQGEDLAAAWLTGFLTRSDREDEGWVMAVRDLTTPALLENLEAQGPSAVGLDRLGSWRVARIVPFTTVDQPVNTESRMVLSYAATVTDGHATIEKPFQLYCYRVADGRWLVASVDQPYSSEG